MSDRMSVDEYYSKAEKWASRNGFNRLIYNLFFKPYRKSVTNVGHVIESNGGQASPTQIIDAAYGTDLSPANSAKKEYDDFFNSADYRINSRLQQEANKMQLDADALNREFQQSSAREAMAFSAEEAAKQREWQTEMSNTAYQRATADMRKAGLNPLIAYSQGGAAVSSGATASGVAASGSSSKLDTSLLTGMIQTQISSNAMMASGFANMIGLIGSAFLRKKAK